MVFVPAQKLSDQPRSQGSLLPAPWGRVGENPGNEVALRYSMIIYPQYRFSLSKDFLLKDAPNFTAQMSLKRRAILR